MFDSKVVMFDKNTVFGPWNKIRAPTVNDLLIYFMRNILKFLFNILDGAESLLFGLKLIVFHNSKPWFSVDELN